MKSKGDGHNPIAKHQRQETNMTEFSQNEEPTITTPQEALAAVMRDGDALRSVPRELRTARLCASAIINEGWRELSHAIPQELWDETLSMLYGNDVDKPAGYHADLGSAHMNEERYDEAIKAYTEAIKRGAPDLEHYRKRGAAYKEKGEYDSAIGDFTEAIALAPDKADPYIDRGKAHLKKGRFDEAIGDFDRAIAVNPKNARHYESRGEVYRMMGRHDRAIDDYTHAIKLGTEEDNLFGFTFVDSAYEGRAMTYADMGEYELAVKDYDEASKTAMFSSDTTSFRRGVAHAGCGNREEAIKYFEWALERDPDFEEAKIELQKLRQGC